MNSVFAHSCYGVILNATEQKKLDKLVAKHTMEDGSNAEYALDDALEAEPGVLAALIAKYGASNRAGLAYTGNDDEHYAGSATDAGLWILGYGVLMFPGCFVPPTFRAKAKWHSWVTGQA